MTAQTFDIALHVFSMLMVVGITSVGIAVLPWSNKQCASVELAFVELGRIGRGWIAGRLNRIQATRTNLDWANDQRVCIS